MSAWELRSWARSRLFLRMYWRALRAGRAFQQDGHHWSEGSLGEPQEQVEVGFKLTGRVMVLGVPHWGRGSVAGPAFARKWPL